MIIYPELDNVPLRFAISKRNKWMVEQADIVIAYITHTYGGAYATYRHAKKEKQRDLQYFLVQYRMIFAPSE